MLTELQAHYEELLAAAVAHGHCRHWLLDVPGRRINGAAAGQWFGEEFSPRLPQALGRPVVVAYFAMVGQDVASAHPALGKIFAKIRCKAQTIAISTRKARSWAG